MTIFALRDEKVTTLHNLADEVIPAGNLILLIAQVTAHAQFRPFPDVDAHSLCDIQEFWWMSAKVERFEISAADAVAASSAIGNRSVAMLCEGNVNLDDPATDRLFQVMTSFDVIRQEIAFESGFAFWQIA